MLGAVAVAVAACCALVTPRFDAADFADLLSYRTVAHATYSGVPLADLAAVPKGNVLRSIVREVDARRHPRATIADAIPGTRVDGTRRSQSQAAYDWRRDDSRVACKGSQLTWDSQMKRWRVCFANVKPAGAEGAYDELLLALYSPRGVHIYRHDGQVGLSGNGRATAVVGRKIVVCGPRQQESWEAALDDRILPRLDASGCTYVDFVPIDDPQIAAAITLHPAASTDFSSTFAGVPLANCDPRTRSALLKRLVREVDARRHPEAAIANAIVSSVSRKAAAYDWQRDDSRVACKSSGLIWSPSHRRWKVLFKHVKPMGADGAYDELLLALYSPWGVHVYRHDRRIGVSTSGKETAVMMKHEIGISGPAGEESWRTALDEGILPKLDASGCERVAEVSW